MSKIKLGVLGSTKGTDLQAIIDAIDNGKLNATVEIVISNVPDAYILTRAENNGIPHHYLSHINKNREEFDDEISELLKKSNVDLVLLIGFMRILSSKFCNEWKDRVINVHPSLLPKYAGGMDINVHEEVLKNGDRETGCTIHFVTDTVDGGPILIQKKCTVSKNETTTIIEIKGSKA